MKRTTLMAAALLLAAATTQGAMASARYPVIKDKMVKEECGACHMPFLPSLLPARSWEKIMDTLPDHFGEDASLPQEKVDAIKAYLMDNAADSLKYSRMMRGLKKKDVPLRITRLPYWIRAHKWEVPARRWKDPRVGSKSNCKACHRAAEKGWFGDD